MISVILPVLNEAAAIEATLDRLLKLDCDFEILVVDGGSSDDTVAIARRRAVVLTSERGRAAQMNGGAKEAKGEVLLFLHADTRLPQGALLGIEEALRDPAVIGGRFRVRLDSPRFVFRIIETGINLRDRLFGGFTGDQAIFIRASVFREMGGYRSIPLMEDLDLARRMVKQGKVARLSLAATTSARRWEKNGIVRTVFLMWALRLSYLAGMSPTVLARFYRNTR